MENHTASVKVAACLLSVLLASCGTTRHLAPSSPEELTHLVLLIKELPDGTVTHSWQRAEEMDLSQYRSLASAHRPARAIITTVGWNRDCDEENRECVDKCMDRPLPPGFGHMTAGNRKRGAKGQYCREQCERAYRDCRELERLQPREFTAIDTAVDWLKRNHKAILVGSVVMIAGVAFVVVSAGAGAVILAPAVLLAAPGEGTEPVMAEVSP
jgi:hypothetical protein